MKSSILLCLLPTFAYTQGNASNFNFLGSTPTQRHVINTVQAMKVMEAAIKGANEISVPENIAILDTYGFLVAFLRMDDALLGSIDIALKKAKTVALFNGGYTSESLYNVSQPGGPIYGLEETNGGLVVFGGGLPIYVNESFVGAIGVSGGTAEQDTSVAAAGVKAVGSTS